MSTMKSRLGDIQGRLSGREMALAEIRRDLETGSMRDSLLEGLERAKTEKPLCTRIAEAIESSKKWKDQGGLARVVADHQREALVLIRVWLECNERVLLELPAIAAKGQHLATMICLVIQSSLLASEKARLAMKTAKKMKRTKPKTDDDDEEPGPRGKYVTDRPGFWLERVKSLAEELLGQVYRTRFAIEWLEREYFGGLELLFDDLYVGQRKMNAKALRLVRGLNRTIAFVADGEWTEEAVEARMKSIVNIAAVKHAAAEEIRPIVALMIRGATAAAHGMLEEDEEATAIYQRLTD